MKSELYIKVEKKNLKVGKIIRDWHSAGEKLKVKEANNGFDSLTALEKVDWLRFCSSARNMHLDYISARDKYNSSNRAPGDLNIFSNDLDQILQLGKDGDNLIYESYPNLKKKLMKTN